ncbi:MAG: hypothetical protein ACYCXF_02335 [Thermoleophilia bacterium]
MARGPRVEVPFPKTFTAFAVATPAAMGILAMTAGTMTTAVGRP